MIKFKRLGWENREAEVLILQGKTLVLVNRQNYNGDEALVFVTSDGEGYLMWHDQDCCEAVWIEDIVGDFSDLIGTPMLVAEERSNSEDPPLSGHTESYTWTYYTFRTIKGSVDIRWYGESNGYYSESVNFEKVELLDFKLPVPDNFNENGEE